MKKRLLLLLTSLMFVTGCDTSYEYTPSVGGLVEPQAENKDNPDVGDDSFNDDAT